MAILDNNQIWLKRARLSFPALVVAKESVPGATPKFSADFIVEPDAVEWGELSQLIQNIAVEKWGDQATTILGMINNDKRQRCYGQGSEKVKAADGTVYAGYEGKMYIGGNNASQPQLIGSDAQALPPTANLNELFNGGNYVSAILNIWAQDNQFGKAIRGNLVAVQYIEKGESFGVAPTDATSIFQQVEGAPAAGQPVGGMTGMAMPGMAMPGSEQVDPLA